MADYWGQTIFWGWVIDGLLLRLIIEAEQDWPETLNQFSICILTMRWFLKRETNARWHQQRLIYSRRWLYLYSVGGAQKGLRSHITLLKGSQWTPILLPLSSDLPGYMCRAPQPADRMQTAQRMMHKLRKEFAPHPLCQYCPWKRPVSWTKGVSNGFCPQKWLFLWTGDIYVNRNT